MPIELNLPVVRAIRQRLVDDLPDTLAAIAPEAAADGVTLAAPAPEQILPYVPPPSDLLVPPVIGVGDAPSRFEDDAGFSATGRHELLIVAYDQSSEQQALAWQLRWWTVALVRIVLADRQLGGAAWGTGLVAVYPGPTLADDPDHPKEWFSWTGIHIWAKRDEDA